MDYSSIPLSFPDSLYPDFPLQTHVFPIDLYEFLETSPSADENNEGAIYRCLLAAASTGDEASLDRIQADLIRYPNLVNRLDPIQNASPLHFAALKGQLGTVRQLVSNGASVDIWNGDKTVTPLMCASVRGHLDVVKYLLEQDINVNKGLNDPGAYSSLTWAVRGGHMPVVQYLISNKASQTSTEAYSETAIHTAVTSGHPEILGILLAANGMPQLSMGPGKHTPLHFAASGEYFYSLECCRLLLETSAVESLNAKDSKGMTPLHMACIASSPDPDVVRLLLSSGAEVDATDEKGRTPLFHLVRDSPEAVECMEVLIKVGKCDLNVQDENGYTALHAAAYKEAAGAADLLLMNGADFSIRAERSNGASALSLLLRRIPSTSTTLRRALNNAVTLSGYDSGDGNQPKDTLRKNTCILKVDLKYVVSSSNQKPSSIIAPAIRHACVAIPSPDVRDGNEMSFRTGTRRKNAKVWSPKSKVANSQRAGDANTADNYTKKATEVVHRKETCKIKCLIDENQGKLLLHPVVHTFLYLKWQKAKSIFISIFAFKLILVLLFSVYVHLPYWVGKKEFRRGLEEYPNGTETNMSAGDDSLVKVEVGDEIIPIWFIVLYSMIVFLATINGLLELAQMIRTPKKGLLSLEPLIFLAVLVIMIFYTAPKTAWKKTDVYLHRTLAAAGIWLAWVDLWIYMGRFPVFGHSIRIFFKVLWNFCVFITPHSCLFVGFVLAFTLIFTENAEFSDVLHTLSKSVRIMAGDTEFPLDVLKTEEKNSYVANILAMYIYTAYISTVGIVLMNLLIGLAVHDIQGIYKEASMHRLTKQTILLYTLESNFSGTWVARLVPKSFLAKYITLFHPASLSKSFAFRPFDVRDQQLNNELKRALVKLKTENKSGNGFQRTFSEDRCRNCATQQEQNEDMEVQTQRLEGLLERLENVLKKMETSKTRYKLRPTTARPETALNLRCTTTNSGLFV